MDLSLQLTELGLNEKEAKIYLAALELGTSSILELSKKSGVNRATIYHLIDGLIDKGLLVKAVEGSRVIYSAANEDKLMTLIKHKESLLKSIMPELAALNNQSRTKPKVTFYEGGRGFINGVSDILEAKNELLTFSSYIGLKTILDIAPELIKARIEKKIFNKIIGPRDSLFEQQQKFDKDRLREMRLMPQDKYPFSNLVLIYNDKVSIISHKDHIALIIESKDIADSWRSIFNFCWDILGESSVK